MIDQFNDVIRNIIVNYMSNINTCLPATIETYDPATKKASVKPLLKRTLNGQEIDTPVIENVPIIFPCTATAVVSLPINTGDGCLLVFSQRSIDDWLSKGGNIAPTDPRLFDLSDAIAIPGLFNFKDSGRTITGENVEIYNDNGKIEIQGTDDNAVRYSKLEEAFNELKGKYNKLETALSSIISGAPIPEPGNGAPSALQTALASSFATQAPLPSTADITPAKVEEVTLP